MRKVFAPILISLVMFSCTTTPDYSEFVPANGSRLPYTALVKLANGTEVRNGGFGSAMVAHPQNPNMFYALTDRGPNATYTGEAGKGKKFPAPSYSPRIGLFQVEENGDVSLVNTIILKNPDGEPITGLPNPMGRGTTGEIPYDNNGNALDFDDYGLDGEGLVALPNGEFWVCDEYGPHIVHYDRNGVELERISPVGVNTGDRKLPAVFKNRRPNRGMEGLTITPDGKTLVGIMQSTLYNPSKTDVTNKKLTRIVTFDLKTAETHQYLYLQEKDWNANSEITALSNTEFLVVERDGKFSGDDPQAQKHIYRVDVSEATDVSGDFDSKNGLIFAGKTLEQMSIEELLERDIKTAAKSLVVDLVKYLPNHYPHEKLEGLWLIDRQTIGVLNDDDFAVSVKDGEVVQKILPGVNQVDGNTLYIINLEEPF